MDKFKKAIFVCSLLLISLAGGQQFTYLQAENWQDITQPIGTLVRVWNTSGPLPIPLQPPVLSGFPTNTPVEEVNYIAAQWDFNVTPQTVPFDLNTAVTEIILTQPQHFVRVYAPASGSGPNGVWLERSETIRGLTPEQIKDRFALPTLPTYIVNVDLPASPNPSTGKDYALWTGIAGPIAGFGNGGGVQNRIIVDFNGTHYFPNYQFVLGTRDHPQPIGLFALSYQPMAGGGNLGRIAAYLDEFIPPAYSDLEYVYTVLDYLNWVGYGPDPIRQALDQISPERYAAIPFMITRNALLLRNAIFEQIPCFGCNGSMPCSIDEERVCCEPFFTIQSVGEFIRERKLDPHTSFKADTIGGVATIDYLLEDNLMAGVCAAGMSNYLKLDNQRGNAHISTAKLGLYSAYFPTNSILPNAYICEMITGGYNWTKADRSIEFPGVDRLAHSRQRGWDLDTHLRGGFSIPFNCWEINSAASLSYFFVHQNTFKEHGANSLDLHVKNFNLQTLRTNLGFDLCRNFNLCWGYFAAQMELGWAHDCILGNRSLHAGLDELEGYFSVTSIYRGRDSLITGWMLTAELVNGLAIVGRYDLEITHYFTSQAVKLSIDWCF